MAKGTFANQLGAKALFETDFNYLAAQILYMQLTSQVEKHLTFFFFLKIHLVFWKEGKKPGKSILQNGLCNPPKLSVLLQ